jgi:small-conductance mechanosensitive channel
MRASGFATSIARYGKSGASLGGSVFDLLDLDPLSALDPATREIARTRHFAERALFLVQRMPTILRWQSELLATSVARLPEIQTALADTTRLTEATERMSRTAEQLPADLARERQIVLDALQMQSRSLSTLAGQVQQTLKAGTEMANSTNATLQTFDHVYAELHGAPKDPHAKPFRIDDYKELATQIAVTATEINDTLKSLENLAGSPTAQEEREYLKGMAADLERRGDRLIERLLRAGQLLIALACSGLLAVLLIYRLIAVRWSVRAPPGP